MSRRVLLHVGTPKTGTSHLQDVLFRNREQLREHGVLYLADRFDAHFLAALDLMQLRWGGLEEQCIGEWNRLADGVRDFPGTSIISHEILATASHAAGGARAGVARPPGRRGPRRAVGARPGPADPGGVAGERQAPPRARATARSCASCATRRATRASPRGSGAPRRSPTSWIAGRATCRPERVHLVTVPPPGGPPDQLWQRFASVFGLDDLDLDLTAERANPSLGVPETALLRRLNVRANAVVPPAVYRPLVRELLAHQTLSRRTTSPRLDAAAGGPRVGRGAVARRGSTTLRERGYDVVGDLDDLVGAPPVPSGCSPTPTTPTRPRWPTRRSTRSRRWSSRTAGCVRAEQDLAARLAEAESALERSYLRPTYRLREKACAVCSATGARAAGAAGLPAAAGQELAVGVAADPPGDEAVGAHADQATDDRHPPADRGGQPLAGDLGDQLGRHVTDDHRVEVGVVGGRGGERHRRRRELLLAHQLVDGSSPRSSTRIALRTRGSSRS